jgi:hypothetical protein
MAPALLYDRIVSLRRARMLTKGLSTQVIRSSQCCERSAGPALGWLFARPA